MKKIFALILFLFMSAPAVVGAGDTCVFEVHITLDTEVPQTTHDYTCGVWHKSDFPINLTAKDSQSGIAQTYYRINEGNIQSGSANGRPVISVEGDNIKLEYWSVDEFGNEEEHKFLTGIKLDKTPPAITILSPQDIASFDDPLVEITGKTEDNLSGAKNITIDVEGTSYFPRIDADGNFNLRDVPINSGANSIIVTSSDLSGNEGQNVITVFLGWAMRLEMSYYTVQDFGSAAACCQMILNYLREELASELNQEEIYFYARQYNNSPNIEFSILEPQAIDYTLDHFDPYDLPDSGEFGNPNKGYNFGIRAFDSNDFTNYLRDIIHWIAYPVTIDLWQLEPVRCPNVAAVVPLYGNYHSWVIVNGAAASKNPMPQPYTNPWYTPDFAVYGVWLTDPSPEGIGRNLYVEPHELKNTYFYPLQTTDAYRGKYLQIAEPPHIESGARVKIEERRINDETKKAIEIAQNIAEEIPQELSELEKRKEMLKKHIYDAALAVNLETDTMNNKPMDTSQNLLDSVFDNKEPAIELDWKQIIGSAVLCDKGFKDAFDGSTVRTFIKVRRLDKENSFYYLIPFDKYVKGEFLTYAAVIIDVEDGSFKEASWTQEPARFIQISKDKAIEILSQTISLESTDNLNVELTWQPGQISSSPFYPYWRIAAGKIIYYVTQEGKIIKDKETTRD